MSTRPKKNLQREKKPNGAKKTQEFGRKRPKSKAESGSYRIIGGFWRSRRLSFPVIECLRPTTDRVRETVFNWVSSEIHGAKVLDVFAGSGSLGLEALSRGAVKLTAIEKNKQAALALQANIELLMQSNAGGVESKVIHTDALSYLESLKTLQLNASTEQNRYDLIFLDPPFRKGLLEQAITLLDDHPIVQEGALIYLEREKEMAGLCLPENWRLLKDKTAGQLVYQLFRVSNSFGP